MPPKVTVGNANQGAARKAKKNLQNTELGINEPTWSGLNPNQKTAALHLAVLELLKIAQDSANGN